MKDKIKAYLRKKAQEEMQPVDPNLVNQAMQEAQGNPQMAANMLGVPLNTILGAIQPVEPPPPPPQGAQPGASALVTLAGG